MPAHTTARDFIDLHVHRVKQFRFWICLIKIQLMITGSKYCFSIQQHLKITFISPAGQQEFKGRSKKNTLSAREKAQARKSSDGALQVRGFISLGFLSIDPTHQPSYIETALSAMHPSIRVVQRQEHSPLTNATWVRLPAWEVCELGLGPSLTSGIFSGYSGLTSPNKNR